MNYLSVCSGIEAASVAWSPLGWKPWGFSEIDRFPSAVLAHHYPDTPNLGDMIAYKDWPDASLDVLCGGTPCQSFSNAGLRAGLDDPRGQLMLTFGAIAAKYRPRWLVWENVPGVLSSNGGRDFGSFLGLLGFLGYGFAYRVLDAQFVRVDGHGRAVPQRRNRVFVVGCLGDWRSAAAVLLERESLRGDPAPRRQAGARVAATLTRGAESSGKGGYAGRRQEDDVNIVGRPILAAQGGVDREDKHTLVSLCLNAKGGGGRLDAKSETLIPTSGGVFDGEPIPIDMRQASRGATMTNNRSEGACSGGAPGTGIGEAGDPSPTISTSHQPAIAFDARQSDVIQYGEKTGPLDTDAFTMGIQMGMQVRRLTPTECERLMGFPDGYTAITWRGKPAADGPRYKALGNSWATNCARWVGRRIAMVDQLVERAA